MRFALLRVHCQKDLTSSCKLGRLRPRNAARIPSAEREQENQAEQSSSEVLIVARFGISLQKLAPSNRNPNRAPVVAS